MAKILDRLDRLERRPILAPTPLPPSWASIATAKQTERRPGNHPQKAKATSEPRLSSNEINEFKTASLVIRTPPGFGALDSFSATHITTGINKTLATINATINSNPIVVTGITILKSKDLRIYVPTRAEARWLLANKHQWTETFCSDLKTFPSRYPVLLHGMPAVFDPNNRDHLNALGNQNRIDPALIQSARWLKNPSEHKKTNGSIVLQLLDKNISRKIEQSGLFLENQRYNGAIYVRSINQCFRCWKTGHTAKWCKNTALCSKCEGNHDSTTCNATPLLPQTCCVCIKNEQTSSNKVVNKLDQRFSHPPWDSSCPALGKATQLRQHQRWKA